MRQSLAVKLRDAAAGAEDRSVRTVGAWSESLAGSAQAVRVHARTVGDILAGKQVDCDIDLRVTEDARKLLRAERQNGELFLEWCTLQQGSALQYLRVRHVLLEKAGVAVVVRAAKENLATVVVVYVQLEDFWAVSAWFVCRYGIVD